MLALGFLEHLGAGCCGESLVLVVGSVARGSVDVFCIAAGSVFDFLLELDLVVLTLGLLEHLGEGCCGESLVLVVGSVAKGSVVDLLLELELVVLALGLLEHLGAGFVVVGFVIAGFVVGVLWSGFVFAGSAAGALRQGLCGWGFLMGVLLFADRDRA